MIINIAGHVSRTMLSRYSHVRMEAKRGALDEIAARQRAAVEKQEKEAEKGAERKHSFRQRAKLSEWGILDRQNGELFNWR